jgi:uncharacterized cupredoxin-like copper-binding protein
MGCVTHRAAFFAMLAALMLTAAACSSEDNGGSTGGTGGATGETSSATTVDVTLQEFGILPATDSAAAGDVTFDVINQGPKETHEFVVIKTDLAPNALPTKADGSVNEEAAGLQAVDEIEDIAVGDTPTLNVSLVPGSYVFICNIVDEEGGKTVSHYQQGMVAAFTVQ